MKLRAKTGIGVLCLSLLFGDLSFSQDFAGYYTGNNTGVFAVVSNPAGIAGSSYRWDVNLFSLGTMAGNDNASYRMPDIVHLFDGNRLKSWIQGTNTGLTNAMASMNLLGPSCMFDAGKKGAFAFTSRARVMVNAKQVDGKLFNQFIKEEVDDPGLPYHFSMNGDNLVNVNAWTEFGASYGRVIFEKGMHHLKGGITLKYLAGVANGYLQVNNLKGTLDVDQNGVYLSETTGALAIGLSGTRIEDLADGDLASFKSSGFGGDIGFIYECRPKPDEYAFKAGVALRDVGFLRYKRDASRSGAYTASITGLERVHLYELGTVDNYNQYFKDYPQYFTAVSGSNGSRYNVSLPATLQLDLDYHFYKGFYTALSGQFSLAAGGKSYNSSYYNTYTLTPRWESKNFGVYLPAGYSELTHVNVGFGLRVGPFFLGSGSLLSALVIEDSRQADFYVGVHFGRGRKG